jgi:maltose alpha-D-glucosyltransferase/alpha-amylase
LLHPENRKCLAFVRRHRDEVLLVVANLSRFTQPVALDLSAFKGRTPVELFGQTAFPAIGDQPYVLSLGPHAFYWFSLESHRASSQAGSTPRQIPLLEVSGPWQEILSAETHAKNDLEGILPAYLAGCRWFGGKAHTIRSTRIADTATLSRSTMLAFIQVEYSDAETQMYLLPLILTDSSGKSGGNAGQGVIARVRVRTKRGVKEGLLREATGTDELAQALLDIMKRARPGQLKTSKGSITATTTRALKGTGRRLHARVLRAEQSNTSICYGDRLVLKLFRRLEAGTNPDWEIGRFLTETTAFAHTPPIGGAIEYRGRHGDPMTVAVLQEFVPNQGDAWQYTLEALKGYYQRASALRPDALAGLHTAGLHTERSPLALLTEDMPRAIRDLIGPYAQAAELLGTRTGELHAALGSERNDPNFTPEPFTPHYQRSLYQSMRSQVAQVFPLLRKRLPDLPDDIRVEAKAVLDREAEVVRAFQPLKDGKISALRIRCHGDYHLGQVLYTGGDFVILDFEGEPARPLSERRFKRSPLRDVAGMLRSFHYAAHSVLIDRNAQYGNYLIDIWYQWVSRLFLKSYFNKSLLYPSSPSGNEDPRTLLDAYLLEKAVYETGYELSHRPAWLRIPLRGIQHLLNVKSA